jgi:CRISPR system Cascade subunit CasA
MNISPSFNLWSEPWINVERPDGVLTTFSLVQTLQEAHTIHNLYEPSPLVVAGIHRLLVAILQDIYCPRRTADLLAIWRAGRFADTQIASFGEQYGTRFDLFDENTPFLQTADLPLQPAKGENAKPVGYLLQELPAGTAVTHYNHLYDAEQIFCTACAAKGLLLIPPFASSGGSGIRPSINGVPPIYVLPGGKTLFDSLTASLTAPKHQPGQAAHDRAWWQRPLPVIIDKKAEVRQAGYLHSLTFPARRVRLHPISPIVPCTRCGVQTPWGVKSMIYEMGESRPKEAPFWRDPFAAYRPSKKEGEQPLPVRPVEGRALWREFAALFLPDKGDETSGLKGLRPAILEQLDDIWRADRTVLPYDDIPLRTIGLRTDMKMKIFEWEESGFAVPPRLLTDPDSAKQIKDGLEFARQCDYKIRGVFSSHFGGRGKSDRYAALKQQMSQHYWRQLGQQFREHVQQYQRETPAALLFHQWLDQVLVTALRIFQETAESLPNDGPTLRKRQEAINDSRKFLYGFRKKNYPKPEEATV